MCGILGVVGDTARFRPRVQGALDSIAHRGPDGEGIHAAGDIIFGHRRLAIIDLGPGGHQPMIDPATGTVITFNGEIYNYRELRDELVALGAVFRTQSDTEVLLHAFIQWREAMLPKLNGMWAFAVWEPARKLLTLSRDRFGVKPLYWHVDRGTLLFGSEAKSLLALLPTLDTPNVGAVYDMIVDSRSHAGSASYYRDIAVLPPATVATFRVGDAAPAMTRYWSYPEPHGVQGRADDATFTELFEDAVRLRMRSDVPVGLTLSGGLDSSAVLAAAQKLSSSPVTCYTSVYDAAERGEERWARIAADAWGARLESVAADQTEWLPTLERVVYHMDGPGFSPAVFPLWAIMARARAAGVPVLLEGQGADELLGGYPQHGAAHLASALGGTLTGRSSPAALRRTFVGLSGTFGAKLVAQWMLRQQAPRLFERAGPRRERERLFIDGVGGDRSGMPGPAYGPLGAALHHDHSAAVLPALLHYGDAISMAHGIEARLPFMDYRLVEWAFRTSPALIADGRTKAPVRHYLTANRLQAIAERRDKAGYPTMIARWLNTGVGRSFVDDMVTTPNAPIWSILERGAVAKMVERARGGEATPVYHLYKIVSTHLWLSRDRVPATVHAARPEAVAA